MAFCMNCGTQLKEGALFCHECGSRADVNMMGGQEMQPAPGPAQSQPATPQMNYLNGKADFEIIQKEFVKMLSVKLDNGAFRYESGAMYYMLGDLVIEANLPSAGGFLKSMVTKESVVKPVIRGTGTAFLEPTFGEFTILELNDEEWIFDKGAYYASDISLEVGVLQTKPCRTLLRRGFFFRPKSVARAKWCFVLRPPRRNTARQYPAGC